MLSRLVPILSVSPSTWMSSRSSAAASPVAWTLARLPVATLTSAEPDDDSRSNPADRKGALVRERRGRGGEQRGGGQQTANGRTPVCIGRIIHAEIAV